MYSQPHIACKPWPRNGNTHTNWVSVTISMLRAAASRAAALARARSAVLPRGMPCLSTHTLCPPLVAPPTLHISSLQRWRSTAVSAPPSSSSSAATADADGDVGRSLGTRLVFSGEGKTRALSPPPDYSMPLPVVTERTPKRTAAMRRALRRVKRVRKRKALRTKRKLLGRYQF